MSQHQLAHVLARHADDLSHVGQPDQIRRHFDQPGRRRSAAHISQRATHSSAGIGRFASELQRQSPRLPDTDQGVIAAGFAQALDQRIRVAVVVVELVFSG